MPGIQPADRVRTFVAALRRNDVDAVRNALETSPELKGRVNDSLPGLAFDSAPIHAAVEGGSREIIDLLLDAGADINLRTRWWAGGFGVLDSADPALVPYLVERGATIDAHAAARLGMLDHLRELVAADPSVVHARGGDGQTPLHCASTVEVAQYLLDSGAHIDARDIDHESTPAQWMIRDRQGVAQHLISQGCHTDLLMASAIGDLERVRAYLDADPSLVRMTVSDRYFPKQNPRSAGTIYIWTLGAHKTAHAIAREFGHQHIYELLMDRSPAEWQLTVASELGDERIVDALLTARPALIEALSSDEHRRLTYAAEHNDAAAVKRMLDVGWPSGARGENNVTALHWAAFQGNAEMTRELLRRNAPIDVRDSVYDATPLGWAVHGSVHGWHPERGDYPAVVEALLRAGAKPPAITPDLDATNDVLEVLRRYSACALTSA